MNREQWELKREHHPEVAPLAAGSQEPKRQRRNVSERRKKKLLLLKNAASTVSQNGGELPGADGVTGVRGGEMIASSDANSLSSGSNAAYNNSD